MNRLDEMVKRFRPAIIFAAETLKHQGVKGTEELKDTILQSSAAVQ